MKINALIKLVLEERRNLVFGSFSSQEFYFNIPLVLIIIFK